MQGIDLFSGAGGMSVGATMCGVNVRYAVELDRNAARTFFINHSDVKVFNKNIKDISSEELSDIANGEEKIVFGGPPCQGFSTSNQKTRSVGNQNNWLFLEYVRVVKEVRPDWIVFENVKGLIETESGFFLEAVLSAFKALGYTTSHFILNSANYGVPQRRSRLFIIGHLHGRSISEPRKRVELPWSVEDAIGDLPVLENGDRRDYSPYSASPRNPYASEMRGDVEGCWNNIVTNNARHIIERYGYIPQGGNWENIPADLLRNYADASRCHTGIYRRLKANEPSVVIGNFRKNMLVHPWENRGLSVREAARLQSFPDWFRFTGSIGFQQQQVGNAVPPLLAKAVFGAILKAAA